MTDDRRWIDGLRDAAREVLPPPAWTYLEAGAREQTTRDAAEAAWREHALAPHVLRDVSRVDVRTTLLGSAVGTPIGVAPTSMQRAAHDEGEIAMARGAAEAGALHVVSSNAGHAFADIAADGPWWLQLYLPQDRDSVRPVVEAAVAAGASAVVLTVDTPVPGTKYDVRDEDWDGIDLSWHRRNLPPEVTTPWARDLTPDDLGRLREMAGVPVVAKGVLRADDARRCVAAGAEAVWVSNHGGRQLDRALTTARALPAVVSALGGEAEVYVDGGVRSGLDALVALALGADAVLVGRPPFRALAVDGSAGVRRLLEALTAELEEAMALAGAPRIAATRGLLAPRTTPV